MNRSNQPIHVSMPAAPLLPYISHYWLSLDNRDESYSIAPDGSVDIVVAVGANDFRVDAFGTTTQRSTVQLDVGSHYLGVRFKPGQSRHFLEANASELTNAACSAEGAFLPDMPALIESVTEDSLFTSLDAALLQHLKQRPPRHSRIDDVIRHIETTHGSLRVSELAGIFCKSRRQLERTFLDAVGLSPKLFAEIVRFQRASALLANSNLPLASIAAVIGYTDQSHFTHEFVRFHGQAPSRVRQHAAFLQDQDLLAQNNAGSFYIR